MEMISNLLEKLTIYPINKKEEKGVKNEAIE